VMYMSKKETKSSGCKNVTKGGTIVNEDEKKRFLNLFWLFFIPGFILIDAWFGLLVAKFVISAPLEPPYVEFLAVYISWVLLIIGVLLMTFSFFILRKRRSIC